MINNIDLYTKDYKLLTLPIKDDPFLKELDLYINKQLQEETKESFVDFLDTEDPLDMIRNHSERLNNAADLPDSL